MPVLAQARESARKTTCVSNLRQIGVGFSLYMADYDSSYLNTGDPRQAAGRYWRWPLKPYLSYGRSQVGAPLTSSGSDRNVLWCPSDSATSFDETSYSYSRCFFQSPANLELIARGGQFSAYTDMRLPETQFEAAVEQPAAKILVSEWTSNHEAPRTANVTDLDGAHIHLFADYHAKFVKQRALLPSQNGRADPNLTVGGIAGRDIR